MLALLSCVFLHLGSLRSKAACTNVTSQFIGIASSGCTLPPLSLQATNPYCETVADGFPISYLRVTLFDGPSGYSLTNGVYLGWCMDANGIIEPGPTYKPVAYFSTEPLPPNLAHTNWNYINYILNHKQGNSLDIQEALWYFIGGPIPPGDPTFNPPTATSTNIVNDALANGASFVPGPGQIVAVILDLGPDVQLNIVEVICSGKVEICEGGSYNFCTTNSGTPPFGFMWFKNGVMINGQTNSCLSLSNLIASDSGIYSVKVTNDCSSASNFVTLIVTNTSDNIPPVIVCASNQNYQCLGQVPGPNPGAVVAMDNSGSVTVMFVDTTYFTNVANCEYRVIHRYKATDPCGNMAFCSQTNFVRDTIPPVLVGVPPNATYQCLSDVPPMPVLTATDNCDTNVQVFPISSIMGTCPYIIERCWRAVDDCGNETNVCQVITVRDTIPPIITCPPDLTVPTIGAVPPCPGTFAGFLAAGGLATDNCDTNLTYFCNDGPLIGSNCGGYFLRTHTVVDDCTNAASCTQRISITTNIPPTITCPPTIVVQCSNNVPACPTNLIDFVAQGGTVSGSNLIYMCIDGPYLGDGCSNAIVRTHKVTDDCTNSASCTQLIIVRDTTPPTIALPPGIQTNFQCFSDYQAAPPIIPIYSDNCGTNLTLTAISSIAGSCPTRIEICWTVMDACSNSASICAIITIRDTIPPVIVCPGNITVPDLASVPPCATNLAQFIAMGGSASDNCDTNLAYFCFDGPFIGSDCGGYFLRTHTMVDDCTNSASCTQRISISSNVPPTIVCPPNLAFECTNQVPPCPTNLAGFLAAGGQVGGSVISYVCVDGPLMGGPCGGTILRTHTVSDSCTNFASCVQVITIQDTTPPNITCADDLIVECNGQWNFLPPFAVDICDGTNVTIIVVGTVTNLLTGECPKLYTTTRTWRATDACGNFALCSQKVTVVDTTPPNITCADDLIVECGISWNFLPPTAVDVCDKTNVTITIVSTVTNLLTDECPKLFTVTRTWRAEDTCGNSTLCSQRVTVVDTTPPNITCEQNKQAECGTDWFFDIPTAVDICYSNNILIQVVSTVTNIANPRCPDLFSVTRTWRATDPCGNSSFCNQTVTIVDTLPPNITCGPDKDVQCGTDWAFDIPTANDICDLNNVIIEVVATVTNVAVPRCPRIFSVTRTWRAMDTCGNAAFCNQTVTIIDTEPPNITCGPNKEVECGTSWAFDIPTAVDLCDANNVLIEVVSTVTNVAVPRCPQLFSVTRTWRATDTCGNASFCNQTVTVVDLTPPNLLCRPNKEVDCGSLWFFDIPTAEDLCDGVNTIVEVVSTVTNITTPACPSIFSVTRTWRATDTCGNAAFCNQTVTVVDLTPPNLVCADDQIVECGTPFAFTPPTAVDLCDGTNVIITVVSTTTNIAVPNCPSLFTVRRTWRASDTCGNETFCSQTITVVDTTPPNITCADDRIVECGNPFAFTPPTAIDVCDGTNVVIQIVSTTTNIAVPRCPSLFTVRRTWRVSDTCGNETFCSQTITIVDTTPPNITCADDQIVECGSPFAFTRPTAIDVCDGTNVVIEITSTTTNIAVPGCPNLFTVRRTWRAYDTCTNETFCSQTITVVDTTPPNLTCADNMIVECGIPFAFSAPAAVDVCEGTNITVRIVSTTTNALCGRTFTATRTWEAFDSCTNRSTCSQTITVVDTMAPALSCWPDKIVECGTSWSFQRPLAYDICDGTNVTVELVSTVTNTTGFCGRSFTATQTWKATDSCTNVSFCSQNITVVDTTPPNLTCADDRLVECGFPWQFTPPFANDICDGTNVTITIVSTVTNAGSCPRTLSATRTWRVTDSCTNIAMCSQTILVVDTRPPVLTCSPDRIVECGLPWSFTAPSAFDVCSGTNVTITMENTVTNAIDPDCPKSYSAVRTWRATDECGNFTFCSQTILVVDTTPPQIACADSLILECGTPWTFIPPTAIDICDGTNVTITVVGTSTNSAGFCGKSFTATRTWRATDTCGNSATCSQTITVVDTTPPNITCMDNLIVECGTPWAFIAPVANDICDGTNVVIQIVSTSTNLGPCGKSLIATRTWRAIDICTNISICSQTITVVDTTPPNISCMDNLIVECGSSWAFIPPVANDICDGTNVTIQMVGTVTNFGPCGKSFTATRTWRAADSCTNISVCSQTITVVDTTPPNITCMDDLIVECGTPWVFTAPVGNDICDGTNVLIQIVGTSTNLGPCGKSLTATRIWRAIDSCTNISTCSQSITVVDTTPPNITCMDNLIVECGSSWAFILPVANDICDGTNVTITLVGTVTNTAGFCGKGYTATRTWRATDSCTNISTCSQTITVVDTTPPNITCADDLIVECGTPWAFIPPVANDICDGTNVTITIVTTTTNTFGFCGKGYTATRTWRATDSCTNISTCSQTITVVDTTPPNITCADSLIVECGTPWGFIPPTANDLCDGTNVTIQTVSTVTNTGPCPYILIATRTWRAFDTCTNISTCSQTIYVVDTTPPLLLNVPANASYFCVADVPPMLGVGVTAVDLCSSNVLTTTVTTNGSCPTIITRTWTATDSCSNSASATQIITVLENPFVITVPPADQMVCDGSNATFCVTTLSSCPLTYQWLKGTNLVDAIVGETNNCLTLTNVMGDAFGQYCVMISSACYTQMVCANLTPRDPLIVTTPDVSTNCYLFGSTITNCVEVFGATNYTVQWYKGANGGKVILPGQTNLCLVVSNYTSSKAGDYTVAVTGPCNTSETVLTLPAPALVCVPTGCEEFLLCPGDSFSICETNFTPFGGVTYTYQWFKGIAFAFTNSLPGETNQCLVRTNVQPSDAGFYSLIVTASIDGESITTNFCGGTVTIPDSLVSVPLTNHMVCLSNSVSFCTAEARLLFITNIGVNFPNGVQIITNLYDHFTWYRNGMLIPGATNNCLTISNVTFPDVGTYCVVVSNECMQITNCGTLNIAGAIGDFVWHDLNRNGCQDLNEPGVSNVVVHLINCATTNAIRTTTTDINGFYLFDCVTPGDYRVRFFLPDTNCYLTLVDGALCTDLTDSDANPATGITACFNLPPGTNDLTRDAGIYKLAALGDFVWEDVNQNGQQDIGEPGVSNVVVHLQNCAGVNLMSTVTDVDGKYLFFNLIPGDYKVSFVRPPIFAFTIANLGPDGSDSDADVITGMTQCYTLMSGETNLTVDAGLYRVPVQICVTKEIACLLPGDNCGPFGKIATGYKSGTNLPAFCYSITISNCGSAAITNLSVLDNQLGNLTATFFPNPAVAFPANGTVTRFFKMAWAVDTTNTVTASGQSAFNGTAVSGMDSAIAVIDTASIVCLSTVFSPDDIDGNPNDNSVQFSNNSPHVVTFTTIICNNGDADLANVVISSPVLAGLGCNLTAPAFLPVGACFTNICTVTYTCEQALLTATVNVTATVDTRTNRCGYDLRGTNITVHSTCESTVVCEPIEPCIEIIKTASVGQALPFQPVTYTFFVTNCGGVTLTNVIVTDDHGTPNIPGDDILVGTIAELPPGAFTNFVRQLIPPVTICSTNTMVPSGMILIDILPNGNVKATFVQAFDVNDNTYGTNSYGWGSPTGHKFSNLTGSDRVRWEFKNGAGAVVLKFDQDYITATAVSSNAPSGYASLGLGGDGGAISGNTAYLSAFDSSLAQNLNKLPFLGNLAKYVASSAASNDVNSAQWEYRMMYSVVISNAAFGPSGFGSASVIDQHNSPGKRSITNPNPCPACDTNVATVTASAGAMSLTNRDDAVVCLSTNLNSALGDFVWRDLNGNGRQDVGEPGVSNVVVQLMDCFGNVLRTTNTSNTGSYLFTKLSAGDYKVTFTPPVGLAFTTRFVGTPDLDSNADPLTGMSECITLGLGETNRTIDAGLVTAGTNICVTKEIACLLPGDNCGVFGETATGYKSGTNFPAFCYRITVTNCGTAILTNITVLDNQLGNLTAAFVPSPATTLAPGQSVTRFFKMAWSANTTNTVIATGTAAVANGLSFTANDSAVALIETASITCTSLASSPDDQDGSANNGIVVLPTNNNPHVVTFRTIVCNNGAVDLANVSISSPALSALGCAPVVVPSLPAGACITNVCIVTVTCAQAPITAVVSVSGVVSTLTGRCGYDITGQPVTARSTCQSTVTCQPPEPCLQIVKSSSVAQALPFQPVTYTYTVTNCGGVTLSNVIVTDDHGTPNIPGDDVVIGTIGFLPPGATTNFSKQLIPPVTICSTNTMVASGMIIIEILPNANVKATFVQAFDVNDNTYGTGNDIGWTQIGKTHTFGNLTGSDKAVWEFKNGNGQVVMRFGQDYISATNVSATFPAGYASLGLGGDGDAPSPGNAAHLLYASSSLAENLNKQPFLGNLAQFTVNSPASNHVNAAQWEYRMMYTVVISNAAFGASGFGSASIIDQHNSPGKRSIDDPNPCQLCVTNLATVTGRDGAFALTNRDDATVCVGTNIIRGALGDFVWNDVNANGRQDGGEPGVGGVTVQLSDCSGNLIRSTNTAANGSYLFGGLASGSYKVTFLPPVGASFTTRFIGTTDLDSNADPLTGMSECVTLGLGETNRTIDAGLVAGPPSCISLFKSVDQPAIAAGQEAIYTYVVSNGCSVTLTNVVVRDDNGTPDFAGDDFVVGTLPTLAAGQSHTFTKSLIPPVQLCLEDMDGVVGTSGQIITEILTNGNIKATFIQDMAVNDNTYGVNAMNWPGGHSFGNLTGSDQATWSFKDANGNEVLSFKEDYITASAGFPSGYGTLGVLGGDGDMLVGNAADVLFVNTSLTDNLNKQPFLGNLAQYTVNSPSLADPNSALWEYRMIYTVIVDKSAFGAAGFGSAMIIDQHNSPTKPPFERGPLPFVCDQCITNIATVTAFAVGQVQSTQAGAIICVTNSAGSTVGGRCPEKADYWKKNPTLWPAPYTSGQTVVSVFAKASLYPDAASKTLLQALDGKAGSNKDVKDLLKEAVAALLNAGTADITYPLTTADIITGVDMALMNGTSQALKSLKDLLKEANEAKGCQ